MYSRSQNVGTISQNPGTLSHNHETLSQNVGNYPTDKNLSQNVGTLSQKEGTHPKIKEPQEKRNHQKMTTETIEN